MNKILLLVVFVVFSCIKSFAQPANDDCSNAIVVGCGATETGSTATATIDVAPDCGPSLSITAPGVWYTFVGTGDAITASLCGSAFDTKIVVYSGSCGSLTCVAGNDDAGSACPSMGLNSIAYFNSVSGTNYYILVTGFGTATGAYSLNIACAAPCVPVPANDDCSGAILLTIAADISSCVSTTGTNTCANNSLINPSCVPFTGINDVWYQFNTGANTGVTIDFDAITGADTYSYALYTSCAGTDVSCGTLPTGISTISGLTASTTYFLQIFNNGGIEAGTFSVCLSAPPGPPVPPPNDDCTGITPTTLVNGAAPVTFTGTTMYATYDAAFSTIVVWEAVILTECSNLQIDYCGTNSSVMQSALIVYTACPVAGFTSGTYDVTTCSDGNVTFRFFNLPAGTYYLPVLGGTPNTPGAYIMNAQSFDCSTIGIEETSLAKNTLLYPNPAADVLNIKGIFDKETIVTITDALGKVLLTENFNSSIDITSLPNGVYMVQIQGENYNHHERFVKAK